MKSRLDILGLSIEKNHPSSRARIQQFLPSLAKENQHVFPRFFKYHKHSAPSGWMDKAGKMTGINPWRFQWMAQNLSRLPLLTEQKKYDLIWQNRLIVTQQSWYEKKLKTPRVFDFDDAIWLQDDEKHVQKAISSAAMVFAGNEYLADYASKYSANVCVIPSVVDTNILFPLNKKDDRFTIGWIGSSGNLPYMEIIKPAVTEFLHQHPEARFIIVSNEPGDIFRYDNKQIYFRKWSPEQENQLINEFSVGLMPIPDTTFSLGKCSYKLLQYMACGIPVIGSAVGTNIPVIRQSNAGIALSATDNWLTALNRFKNDQSFYQYSSANGRPYIENNYSINRISPVIAEKFRYIAGKDK